MTQFDLWLDRIPEVGSATILALREVLGGDRHFAGEFYRMSKKEREETARQAVARTGENSRRVGERKVMLLAGGAEKDPARYEAELEEQDIRFAVYDDPEYPSRLRNIPDPPFGLYYYGRLPSGTHPSAAIIGTRMASAYGRDQARLFARTIAAEGVQIVSGMAIGIDGIAGRGALDADGDTFAVLGCGVDICYPKENADLYGALLERGGILSEYPPGTEPQRGLFPSRNRIISGLSDVVLVIEAREKSGTLITVDRALEYGIDVFALPGRVTDRNSRGCNELIRQGAGIATSPQDILDYIYGEMPMPALRPAKAPGEGALERIGPENAQAGRGAERDRTEGLPEGRSAADAMESFGAEDAGAAYRTDRLSKPERAVYDALDDATPQGIDAILPAVRSALGRDASCREIMRTITLLDMKGLAQEVRVGNYIRVRP